MGLMGSPCIGFRNRHSLYRWPYKVFVVLMALTLRSARSDEGATNIRERERERKRQREKEKKEEKKILVALIGIMLALFILKGSPCIDGSK
jgi:hypothetical protein